tara:strand:- start:53 stop:265 length:213 start_codon:yes stop_codon:yes gene_type:complete
MFFLAGYILGMASAKENQTKSGKKVQWSAATREKWKTKERQVLEIYGAKGKRSSAGRGKEGSKEGSKKDL